MKWFQITLIMVAFISCNPYKYYTKKDFEFYQENFQQKGILPKTQGVYVLEKVWTKRNGYINDHKYKDYIHFYKFFKTGQQNSYLIPKKEFNSSFSEIVTKEAQNYKNGDRTLFQGYYKLKKDYIILENVNSALNNFYYSHGKIENDTLTIISTENSSLKEFDESKLNFLVKHVYVFKSFNDPSYQDIKPNW